MHDFKFLIPEKKLHPTKKNELEYIKKKNAVSIALFDEKLENVIMVKQYRPGNDDYTLEISAGLIEENENPLEAAYRELREETGYSKEMVKELLPMPSVVYTSPAMTTEKMYFYGTKILDSSIKPLNLDLDDTEDIEVVSVPINELFDKVIDMKTILAVLYYKEALK